MNPVNPVKRGDKVIPAWNALLSHIRRLQILPGKGISLTKSAMGTVINSRAAAQPFRGAFWATFGGEGITIGRGFVNSVEPLISGKKISDPEAVLKFDEKWDADGRAYVSIAVKVTSEAGRIDPKDKEAITVELRTERKSSSDDGLIGYHDIAVLIRDPTVKLFQIAYFSLQHSTAKKDVGQGKGFRHFFSPA